jgi:isoprenylcysteine carboxyl methyltransferase (ICMT) family protein YpbQ
VELEILAAPLVHSAWRTSAVFGTANLLLLRDRIRWEEQALAEDNRYWEAFKGG